MASEAEAVYGDKITIVKRATSDATSGDAKREMSLSRLYTQALTDLIEHIIGEKNTQ